MQLVQQTNYFPQSLSFRKEESIARNKKEKIEIDLLISGVYETLTSMQLHRLSAILNKLQALHNKNPQQTCPMELTMERYEDWMKNDAQVNAKQSEILQALTKKVRCVFIYPFQRRDITIPPPYTY